MRDKEDALTSAEALAPVALNRLLIAHEQMWESRETAEAQSRRRDEAAFQLYEAGVTYSDIARLIDSTPERIRQIVARHLEVTVNDLNPTPKPVDRH